MTNHEEPFPAGSEFQSSFDPPLIQETRVSKFLQSARRIRVPQNVSSVNLIPKAAVTNLLQSGQDMAEHVMNIGPIRSRIAAVAIGKSALDFATNMQHVCLARDPDGAEIPFLTRFALPDSFKETLDKHFSPESRDPSHLLGMLGEKFQEAGISAYRLKEFYDWSREIGDLMIERGSLSVRELSEFGQMAASLFPDIEEAVKGAVADKFIEKFDEIIGR